MSLTTHKNQILPLKKQMIPISKDTVFYANFDKDLYGYDGKGNRISPMGYTKSYESDAGRLIKTPLMVNNYSQITVEAWINFSTLTSTQTVVGNIEGAGFVIEYNIGSYPNKLAFTINTGPSYIYALSNDAPIANTWIHVAGVYNGAKSILYINGVPQTIAPAVTGNISNSLQTVHIGVNPPGATSPFRGKISDVRIWNYGRLQTDIIENMDRELSGNETGLVGYWKLDEGEKLVAYDLSVNGNDGLLVTETWGAGRTVTTLDSQFGKYGGAVAVEDATQNTFTTPLTKGLYMRNAFNGTLYGFNSGTNIGTSVDNSDQPISGVDVQSVFPITGDVAQLRYVEWTELIFRNINGMTFQANEERTLSFYYHGTYGTSIRIYLNTSPNIALYADNATSGNGTAGIIVPVEMNKWSRIIFRLKNTSTDSTATFSNGWIILHYNDQLASLSTAHFWKFTGIQVENKSFATSFVNGSRPLGHLLYDANIIKSSNQWTISFWYKPTKLNDSFQSILHAGEWGVGKKGWGILKDHTTQAIYFEYGDYDVLYRSAKISTSVLFLNRWTFITATVSETTITIYASSPTTGVLEKASASAPALPKFEYTKPISFGKIADRATNFGNGVYDELRIETRTVSEDEIMSWYQADAPFYNYLDYS